MRNELLTKASVNFLTGNIIFTLWQSCKNFQITDRIIFVWAVNTKVIFMTVKAIVLSRALQY